MSHEPASNIGMVCPEHAPKVAAKWGAAEPEFFLSLYVKKAFPTSSPNVRLEHMWVHVKKVENGELVGELNNDPAFCPNLKSGDTIHVKLSEIEAVYDGKKGVEL